MNIYVSCSVAGKDVAALLQRRLEFDGHQVLSATDVEPGEVITRSIAALLAKADGFVFIIPPIWNDQAWLMWEWRTALAQSWDGPERPSVGVLSNIAEPPPFLQGRQIVRIAGEEDLDAGISRVIEVLNLSEPPQIKVDDDLKMLVRKRMNKVSAEISKFSLSTEDLEIQRKWVLGKLDRLVSVKPDSIEVANLQIKLAEIYKALGNDEEVAAVLEKGLEILERHEEVPAIKRAKFKATLARTLNNLGKHEKALEQIYNVMDICEMDDGQPQDKERWQRLQEEVPPLVDLLADTLEDVGQETARRGRRILEILRKSNQTLQEEQDDDGKLGGEV